MFGQTQHWYEQIVPETHKQNQSNMFRILNELFGSSLFEAAGMGGTPGDGADQYDWSNPLGNQPTYDNPNPQNPNNPFPGAPPGAQSSRANAFRARTNSSAMEDGGGNDYTDSFTGIGTGTGSGTTPGDISAPFSPEEDRETRRAQIRESVRSQMPRQYRGGSRIPGELSGVEENYETDAEYEAALDRYADMIMMSEEASQGRDGSWNPVTGFTPYGSPGPTPNWDSPEAKARGEALGKRQAAGWNGQVGGRGGGQGGGRGSLNQNWPQFFGEFNEPKISEGAVGGNPLFKALFGDLGSPLNSLQRQSLNAASHFLNQLPPEMLALNTALPALQDILGGAPGQGVIDAMQPSFERNLAQANQQGGRFGSGNAIMRSRALGDFNLLAAQAAQEGQRTQLGAADALRMLGSAAGEQPFGRLMQGYGLGAGAAGQRDLGTQRRLNFISGLLGVGQQTAFNLPFANTQTNTSGFNFGDILAAIVKAKMGGG